MWQGWLQWRYAAHIYALEDAPAQPAAIVFGARVFPNGQLSPMLRDRVETAVRLYEAGRVEYLLLSGDHSSDYYNEPAAMLNYALARGAPREAIYLDGDGNRTFDTCNRAKELYGIEAAILVTQEFHLPRALFLCRNLGLEAVGVPADLSVYSPYSVARVERRETGAAVMALFDIIGLRWGYSQ